MKLLCLGGTQFVGRAYVAEALARGHEVTTFTRGTRPHPFAGQVEALTGHRPDDVSALAGRSFDACFDTSGYFPRQVTAVAEALGEVGHYTFVSSCSAYADHSRPDTDEDAPLATLEDESIEEASTGEAYGGLKVLCERAASAAFGDRLLVVRPGLIVGPHDPTGRFTYWVVRAARGGEMLAPAPPEAPMQVIDARDLASFAVTAAEARLTGVLNTVGRSLPPTLGDLIGEVVRAGGADTRVRWVGEDLLVARAVEPWSELPVWLPAGDPQYGGFMRRDGSRAYALGLTLRPLADTVRDTLAWARELGDAAIPEGVGLTAQREADLLAAAG
jgi:2'-hydroxyisoflavone reductase